MNVQQMLDAPAACAFLVAVEESGLTAAEARAPSAAFYLAADALAAINVWRADYPEMMAQVLARGRRRLDLASDLLTHPASAWWVEPLRRSEQVWVAADGSAPTAGSFTPPEPIGSWERYAQKPSTCFFTSTLIDGQSSAWAAMEKGTSDFDYPFPLTCWKLSSQDDARVYEIDGPQAWHALCAGYPARDNDGKLAPDWPAVAEEWDAVHLSLGGLLLAEQVEVESEAGWSAHWGWHAEQTVWLRWCFTSVEPMAPRERQVPSQLAGAGVGAAGTQPGGIEFPAAQRRLLRSIGRLA
jgi:hypothetical protein